ncbi:LPS assembly lipoprotein LptE [uncultured Alteromonas sp.]|jgi:LPS-assembly lipoprotein|uniref:LPS-assembly lipoprotein LptE n=1 Tax=uncultured Alteromonas sp. TaxID=179113 RepID=UPI0025FD5D8D|nr:LPS assembly lipoprotein LptE [uncultured Alteromonas sp.]
MHNLTAISKTLLILITTLALASCGFHLRSEKTLPSNTDYLYVQASSQNAPLIRALESRMNVYQINGGAEAEPALKATTITLRLQPEKLDRRLLSVFATGQVAEYELIYSVRYTVVFPNGEELKTAFEVLREYQDDPDQVLAKSRELNLVLSEMRLEAADRIIRLLSSQYAGL